MNCGIDEVGRGCLAGPVVAAAVIWDSQISHKYLKDSKKLSKKRIEEMNTFINENAIDIGIGVVSHERIDEINILKATHEAMHIACDNLITEVDKLLVDGNSFTQWKNVDYETVIGGDDLYPCISAASIVAKYYRDNIMKDYHVMYPLYKFDKNVGYGTKDHREAIKQYGYTDIHRKTFKLKSFQ